MLLQVRLDWELELDGSSQHPVSGLYWQYQIYLLTPPGLLLFIFGIFFIPELKGRSLEETDELFDAKLKWAWQFSSYKTQGTGARIAALQNDDVQRVRKLSATSVNFEKGQSESGGESDRTGKY